MKPLAIIISGLVIMLAVASVAVTRTSGPIAYACTGGGAGLEFAATEAGLIFLGRVIDAGDAANRAPTLTPTATPTKTPFFHTPQTTPVSPPVATYPPMPVPAVDLVGIRARFDVEAVYAGEQSTEYEVGADSRALIEEELRRIEAGEYIISDCAIDAFVPRYALGGRYLLFLRHETAGDYALAAFRIEGDDVVFDDDGLRRAGHGVLYLEPDTYRRFFSPFPSEVTGYPGAITAPSVPLASVLRAIAYLRNDPRIYPPDTGSAGLLPR